MRVPANPTMLPDVTVRIVIELDIVTDPIRGRLIKPEAHAGEFRGWLGLTARTEAARLDALHDLP